MSNQNKWGTVRNITYRGNGELPENVEALKMFVFGEHIFKTLKINWRNNCYTSSDFHTSYFAELHILEVNRFHVSKLFFCYSILYFGMRCMCLKVCIFEQILKQKYKIILNLLLKYHKISVF
jgi:hypothetical protein